MAIDKTASTGLKKDGTPKAKRGEGGVPRPGYLVYEPVSGPDGLPNGEIVVTLATRKADELIKAITDNRQLKYVKIELK